MPTTGPDVDRESALCAVRRALHDATRAAERAQQVAGNGGPAKWKAVCAFMGDCRRAIHKARVALDEHEAGDTTTGGTDSDAD